MTTPTAENRPSPASPPQVGRTDFQSLEDQPFPLQQRWFLTLLAFILISRRALLLLSRRHLMSDEAVVGVMALDIMEGKPLPGFYR